MKLNHNFYKQMSWKSSDFQFFYVIIWKGTIKGVKNIEDIERKGEEIERTFVIGVEHKVYFSVVQNDEGEWIEEKI